MVDVQVLLFNDTEAPHAAQVSVGESADFMVSGPSQAIVLLSAGEQTTLAFSLLPLAVGYLQLPAFSAISRDSKQAMLDSSTPRCIFVRGGDAPQ